MSTDVKQMELTEEQLKSCRSAALQVYKMGGYGNTLDDLYHDAIVIALKPRGKREPRDGREFYWKVYFGLIDEYRSRTGCRWFKKRHKRSLRFYSLDEPIERCGGNNFRARSALSILEEKQFENWKHETEDRALPYVYKGAMRAINESELDKIIERRLRAHGEKMRALVNLVYRQGLTYKEAGAIVGKSSQTVLNQLWRFRADVKRDVLEAFKGD